MAQAAGSSNWVRGIVWLAILAAIGGGLFWVIQSNPAGPSDDTTAGLDPVTAEDWQRGAADSAVVLIEYADVQCPACASYMPMLNELHTQYGDRVNFINRFFPLPSHANGGLSARAAEAAGLQGKVWEMLDQLYAQQTEWSTLSDEQARDLFTNMARDLGLDVDRFVADLDSDEVRQAVEADRDSGDRAGVTGTPTFFLNGKKLDNPRSVEAFAELLDAELASTAAPTVEPAPEPASEPSGSE